MRLLFTVAMSTGFFQEEVLGFSDDDSDNEEALLAELKRQKDRQLAKDDMASDLEPSDDEDGE
jgi:hypothetical protein